MEKQPHANEPTPDTTKSWRPEDEHFDEYPTEVLEPQAESGPAYYRKLEKREKLTPEQTSELVRKIKLGKLAGEVMLDPSLSEQAKEELMSEVQAGMRARNELVESHFKLAIHIALQAAGLRKTEYTKLASRSKGRHLALDDYIQLANIGFIRAAESYDSTKGASFAHYASVSAQWIIERAVKQDSLSMRAPVEAADIYNTIEYNIVKFERENARQPTIEEISKIIHLPVDKTEWAYNAVIEAQHISYEQLKELKDSKFSELASYDATGQTEELTLEDTLPYNRADLSVEDEALEGSRRELLDEMINKYLPERERQIIHMRFGLDSGTPMTLRQIGKHFGLTHERIRQLETKALKTLSQRGAKLLREVWDEEGRHTWRTEKPLNAVMEPDDQTMGVSTSISLSDAEESMLGINRNRIKN